MSISHHEHSRLFFALPLPDGARHHLGTIATNLRRDCFPSTSVRWVAPSAFHVTLKFLGTRPNHHIPALSEAARRIACDTKILSVAVGMPDLLPTRRAARVLIVALLDPTGNLARLATVFDNELASLGIEEEHRPFRPHITLARFRNRPHAEGFEASSPGASPRYQIDSICLYRSELTSKGARYTPIATFLLGTDEA